MHKTKNIEPRAHARDFLGVGIKKILIWFLPICFIFVSPQICSSQSNFELFFGSAKKYQDVLVEEVLSADTFRLKGGEKIKLIGARAPAVPDDKKKKIIRDEFGFKVKEEKSPVIPIEEKAFKYAEELLEGKHVRLEFDAQRKDKNHKTLAYVFLLKDNTFVNTDILRKGFAYLQIRPPNLKYADELREAYREARKEQRGVQAE